MISYEIFGRQIKVMEKIKVNLQICTLKILYLHANSNNNILYNLSVTVNNKRLCDSSALNSKANWEESRVRKSNVPHYYI
jgi:hypothetical protein